MTELAMTRSDHTTASETCSRGSASRRDGQRRVRGNPALHARPWNKFRFLIDSRFLPLYMKRGAGVFRGAGRWRQHHPSASTGGATMRQGVSLGGRTFASVALALL